MVTRPLRSPNAVACGARSLVLWSKNPLRRTGIFVGATLSLACATSYTSPDQGTWIRPSAPSQQVVVENSGWSRLTVYLLRDGARLRLGSVESQTTERYEVGRLLGNAVSYRLASRGSDMEEVLSDPVFAASSGVVWWTVGAQGRLTRLTVR